MHSDSQFAPTVASMSHPAAVAPAVTDQEQYCYHRLARIDPRHRWWTPLLLGGLATLTYLAVGVLVVVALLAASALFEVRLGQRAIGLDMADPVTFTFGFASIALMLPVVLLARRLLPPRPVGLLSSVAGRLRWRWLGQGLWRVGLVTLLSFAFQLFALGPLTGAGVAIYQPPPWAWLFLVMAVLLVPLQSAAEEYVFRGFLMQAIGSWLKHPVFAILLPVPLFVVGHDYDLWGQLDIMIFAVAAGWLAWRTGGLEAPIALHVVNNSLFTVMVAAGYADPNNTTGTPIDLAASALTTLVATSWLVRTFDRNNLQRARARSTAKPNTSAPHFIAVSDAGLARGTHAPIAASAQLPTLQRTSRPQPSTPQIFDRPAGRSLPATPHRVTQTAADRDSPAVGDDWRWPRAAGASPSGGAPEVRQAN